MSRSSDKKGFVYTLDVFIAVSIIVAGSWIIMFNLFSQTDTLRPRIISEDLVAESYGRRVAELNYPIIREMTRNGNITDNTKTFSEQIGEFYWLSIKRDDDIYIQRAREMIDEYYRGIIPSQYQFMIRIGDFNEPITRTDAVYFRTDSVSAGGVIGGTPLGHSCAIREDGVLVCWGNNNDGQLGNGDYTNQDEATSVDTNLRFRMVSAGETHTCAITINNELYCWGDDGNGRLGIDANNQITPLTSTGSDFIYVDAGTSHTCGIKTDRSLWCWGSQANGRLGNGETSGDQTSPIHIDAPNLYQRIASGVDHTCGIRTGGETYCWGANTKGQLGNGGTTQSPTPVRAGTIRFLQVDVGDEFSCGIEATSDRKILCWGDRKHESGNNRDTSPTELPPVLVNKDFSQITLGSNHGCGIGTDSNAYCWGSNNFKQIGIGTTGGPPRTLTKTTLDGPYSRIAAGSAHTCAIRLDNNTMNCWGFNNHGQSGQPMGGHVDNPTEIIPSEYDYLSSELKILHSRNTTPMSASQLILPSRTIIAGIDRDSQFYGPFVFEVVVWL